VRLEGYISAELNDHLNNILIDELFETWVQQQISSRLGLFEIEDVPNLSELISGEIASKIDPEILELIDRMDAQPEISALIEPSTSFFFPKEISTSNDDFEEPADGGSSSSFFFPKDHQMLVMIRPSRCSNLQKAGAFLLFFSIFVGVEILGMDMFHRLATPENNVGNSRIIQPADNPENIR
jgi:hypothetical protein